MQWGIVLVLWVFLFCFVFLLTNSKRFINLSRNGLQSLTEVYQVLWLVKAVVGIHAMRLLELFLGHEE